MNNFLAARGQQAFFLVPLFITYVDMLLNIWSKADSLFHQ
jgi:hypothetical protein